MQALAHKHIPIKYTLNDVFKVDPSRTLTLRKAFIAEVNRRFRWLKRVITGAIVDKDVFGLKEELTPLQRKLSVAMAMTVDEALRQVNMRQFAFTRTSAKVDGFMDWLNQMEQRSVLEVIHRPGTVRGLEEAWSDHFIQSSYQKGILRGRQELRKAGADIPSFAAHPEDELAMRFNQPFHADRVGALYTRTFNELKGITAAMDQQISSVLSQGLIEGRNPRELARWLTSTIEMPRVTVKIPGVGFRRLTAIQRARTLARTEVIRAHHQANIQEYRSAGIEGVKVQAEFSTAGHGVCEICSALEGKIFSLDEAESLVPVHPNCRCVCLPFRKEWAEKKVKPVKKKHLGQQLAEEKN